jgi:hypothetical protein
LSEHLFVSGFPVIGFVFRPASSAKDPRCCPTLAFVACGLVAVVLAGPVCDRTGILGVASVRAQETPRLELVRIRTDKVPSLETRGVVLLEAEDGGLLLQRPDGALLTVDKPDLLSRESLGVPFAPLSGHEQARALLDELGPGWQAFQTKRYVVCTQAPRHYAEWCATLLERLRFAFDNFWKQRGFDLAEPQFPLVALILRDERSFLEYGAALGHDLRGTVGFYDLSSNRVVFFDFSGGANERDLRARMAGAAKQVATVVHEATHQMAFNTGLQTRLADNPLWLTEGMAMYFETPDLSTDKGWKTVGAINDLRLAQFRAGLARRPGDSLATLVADDARFTDPERMGAAYAEAWLLTHYLVKTRPAEYAKYVRAVGRKPRLVFNTREERLAEFQDAFGDPSGKLDKELLKYASRLKGR